MTDPNRIRNLNQGRDPSPIKEEDSVDAAKFKKVFKVDEADEAPRKQRKLPKEEEPEEQEKVVVPEETHFSNFLATPESLDNLFDLERGSNSPSSPLSVDTSANTNPPASPIETFSQPPSENPNQENLRPPNIEHPLSSTFIQRQAPLPPKQEENSSSQNINKTSQETSPKASQSQAKRNTSSAKKPSHHKEERKKTTLSSPMHPSRKEDLTDQQLYRKAPLKKGQKEKAPPEKNPLIEETKKEDTPSLIAKGKSKVEEKKQSTTQISSSLTGPPMEGLGKGSMKEKGGKGRMSVESSLSPMGVPMSTSTPVEMGKALPAYAHFSKEVFALFEKLTGILSIEQYKGVSTTTVTLSSPNSVFNGAKILIEHYDTAPQAFNISLQGSPEAVNLFSTNIENLAAAFQQSKLSFEVNLLKPSLLKDKTSTIVKRKGKGGDSQREKK